MMINYTLYFLVILLLLYIIFHYNEIILGEKEPFTTNNNETNYFGTKHNIEDVYDEFYCFFTDDLFFNKENTEKMAEHILGYQNNVYNNHLVLGMKHGGHFNVMIDNLMNTQTAINNKNIYKKCKMNYKNNNFKYVKNINELHNYEPYTFTHISIIDDELYITNDIKEYLYNCSEWLVHKGYLFIELYDSINDFFLGFHKYNLNSQILNIYVYSKNLIQHNNTNNHFTLVEKLSSKHNKNKKRINNIQVSYYTNHYIIDICEGFGLKYIESLNITPGKSLFIFKKTM